MFVTFKVQCIKSRRINITSEKLSKIKEIKCGDGIGTGVFNITIQYNPDKINQINLTSICWTKFFNKSHVLIMCFFCKQRKEDASHIFFSCNVVAKLFSLIRDTLEEHDFILSRKNFLLNINITKHDYKKISIFFTQSH